jgi:hypothetical protein
MLSQEILLTIAACWLSVGFWIGLTVLLQLRKVVEPEERPSFASSVFGILIAMIGWPLLLNQLIGDALPEDE